ncbi:MAG TPA: recombinase family protein, partial [bacterium]
MNNEKIKCGLYVRVSSRNQVDKEYNSLESQREKLEAYCKSQEDFQVYRVYEDGAFSGENMDRPALQAMLQDIRLGKINKVMVYKLDRLTRSRRDFERIYEICQKPNVAILSITQSYDTSTPSGRLLRNLIVEFSQYERDMIADRTRDKMLQRAEKGM